MERLIMEQLVNWKNSKRRKPLIVRGARQIGKTWILREFGKRYFSNTVYVNFDVPDKAYDQYFEHTINPYDIVKSLAIACGEKVTPDTLFIFDEIQTCNNALNALKYFCEDAPEIYVVAAGSLLGLKLDRGAPAGKVTYFDMYPMSFEEFLLANGDENLYSYMNSIDKIEQVPEFLINAFMDRLKMYYTFGGMPEAVSILTEDMDPAGADKALDDVLESFQSDFGKHRGKVSYDRILDVWDSIPEQLAKEYKRFFYTQIAENQPKETKEQKDRRKRSREYYTAINWLGRVNDIKVLYRITKPGLSLDAFRDKYTFKIYMCDVGLLRKKSRLDMSAYAEPNRLFKEFKGALTENYIVQSLLCQGLKDLGYWKDGMYEVDILIQRKNDIIPVEIMSGTDKKKIGMTEYNRKYAEDTKLIVRFSQRNLKLDAKVLNIPLYLADKADRLIGLALDELKSREESE